jgi:hypothetical protein
MSKKIKYTDEPILVGERVYNLLPPPSQLVKRQSTVKVTLDVTQSSLAAFKKWAKRERVPYQRMIRELLDTYARQHV